mmetsp:Transcript_131384/g.420510  ORF Transcript_131384/g.420510 Transcript_131384/m.420510 type:complete len:420 (-) Transcript_131384:92-1351(-)
MHHGGVLCIPANLVRVLAKQQVLHVHMSREHVLQERGYLQVQGSMHRDEGQYPKPLTANLRKLPLDLIGRRALHPARPECVPVVPEAACNELLDQLRSPLHDDSGSLPPLRHAHGVHGPVHTLHWRQPRGTFFNLHPGLPQGHVPPQIPRALLPDVVRIEDFARSPMKDLLQEACIHAGPAGGHSEVDKQRSLEEHEPSHDVAMLRAPQGETVFGPLREGRVGEHVEGSAEDHDGGEEAQQALGAEGLRHNGAWCVRDPLQVQTGDGRQHRGVQHREGGRRGVPAEVVHGLLQCEVLDITVRQIRSAPHLQHQLGGLDHLPMIVVLHPGAIVRPIPAPVAYVFVELVAEVAPDTTFAVGHRHVLAVQHPGLHERRPELQRRDARRRSGALRKARPPEHQANRLHQQRPWRELQQHRYLH